MLLINKTFWKSIKPLFSEKGSIHNKITLVEQDLILDKDDNVADVPNNVFINVVSNLNIPKYHDKSVNIDHSEDPIARSIERYKNRPSIVAIKSKGTNKYFRFSSISKAEIKKEILNLDSSKACQDSNIPTKVIKSNSDIFTDALYFEFNRFLEANFFPPSLKSANVTPVHKKSNRSEKDNYRPVSILPNLSKVFERCIYNQIAQFFDKILSKHQWGFRKSHSAQHSLIVLLEKWKERADQGHVFGVLLTDLSKAFDYLPHNLLIAKLNAYGFDNKAVRFVYDYLTSLKQRTKISDTYSSWQEILSGVPQGSILGPLLFNNAICDLFFIIQDCNIANYADGNTPYLNGKNVEEVLKGLENVSSNLFQWFTENELKGNTSKCYLLISSVENVHVNIGTSQIKNSDCERLLGINIYCKLSFENHINQICSKARAKIKALARIAPFLNKRKRKLLMNAFFKCQFSYCPLLIIMDVS